MFPNLKHDFRRYYAKNNNKGQISRLFNCFWSLGFQGIIGYRLSRWLVLRHIPLIHIFVQRCTELTSGISIPPTVIIGKGLLIEHFGGIMMNAKTKIGDYCTISHGVTIGNQLPGGNAPTIGNKVYICPGAVLVGEIHIGDNSIIGANAVVLNSFAEGSVIGGVPAKLIGKVTDKEEYEKFFE